MHFSKLIGWFSLVLLACWWSISENDAVRDWVEVKAKLMGFKQKISGIERAAATLRELEIHEQQQEELQSGSAFLIIEILHDL